MNHKFKRDYKSVKYQQYWDDLICLYDSKQNLKIIDQYGKIVKLIQLNNNFLDFYCCQDPRFLILQFIQKEFAIVDLLENQQQIYKGEIIRQNDNNVLFKRDGYFYLMSVKEKIIIKQEKDCREWVDKLKISKKNKFIVFNTLERRLNKIFLQKQLFMFKINIIPLLKNQVILDLIKNGNNQRNIAHIQKLNNKIKIIRKIKANIRFNNQESYQVQRQFAFIRVQKHIKVINIIKATSQIIPIKNSQFFIMKNNMLQILNTSKEEFVIDKYYKL